MEKNAWTRKLLSIKTLTLMQTLAPSKIEDVSCILRNRKEFLLICTT